MRLGLRSALPIVLGLVSFLAPGGAQAVTVSVAPSDTAVVVGSIFSLRIEVDAVSDLKGFDLIFRFDPAILQLQGAQAGDVLTSPGGSFFEFLLPDYAAPLDSAWFDGAMLDGSTAGPGILVFFEFKALQVGTSLIECRLADLRDSQNQKLLPACVGGKVVVEEPVPATTATWGRLKSLYR